MGVGRGLEKEGTRAEMIVLELRDLPASPPGEILHICVIFEQTLYKYKISVVAKKKQERHLFTLNAEV